MSMGLTPRQAECLDIIKQRTRVNGVCPTYEEIADLMGLVSRSGITRIVVALGERGLVRRISGKARAIEVIGDDGGYVVHPLPDVRREIKAYASENKISEVTAIEEACCAYFLEAGK